MLINKRHEGRNFDDMSKQMFAIKSVWIFCKLWEEKYGNYTGRLCLLTLWFNGSLYLIRICTLIFLFTLLFWVT